MYEAVGVDEVSIAELPTHLGRVVEHDRGTAQPGEGTTRQPAKPAGPTVATRF
jgi:hypothetical protein